MKNDQWINALDKVPDYSEKVILVCKDIMQQANGKYNTPFITLGCRKFTDGGGEVFEALSGGHYRINAKGFDVITHWMNLPDIPNK